MSVEIMSWNIADAFSEEERARKVLRVVGAAKPTVGVFPEAWQEGQESLLDLVEEDLDKQGYRVTRALYEDDVKRRDRHGILGIVQEEASSDRFSHAVRLAGRNALRLTVVDPETENELDCWGVHYDDRSPRHRHAQAEDC